MRSSARIVGTLFCGVLTCTLVTTLSSRSQTAFIRDDNFDIQGTHTLRVVNDPNNFTPFVTTNSDFPFFKLNVRKRDLWLFAVPTIWIPLRYKVTIDDNTAQDWTAADAITILHTFPNPTGISANHTVGIQVDYVDLGGYPLPTLSGYASYTVFAKPRVYKDFDGNSFVQLRDEDATAKIPVLMIEGFDPLNEKFPEEYYNLTGYLVNTDLVPNGYEVFILNFHDGGRDLRLNAEVVLKAMEKVHEICPNYKIALAGLSMGGPIARYALAKKEGLGETHDVGLFLSYDSPQRKVHSVHVSPNMQDWIYTLDPNIGAVGKMQASLQSVAAKQMLEYNTYDRGRILHNEFYDDLNARNGDGYPHQSYNVAVSNGNFIADPGYGSEGRHLMTLKINDNLINQVPAVRLDCGTGSKISDIRMRRFGDVFPNPLFNITYELQIIFNPSYEPTYSALDLVNVHLDDLTGDIVSFERSKFDDYVVQPYALQHHELSTTTRNKIMEWLDLDFNITVNYNLLEGGSVDPDNYQVNILHGIPITVQPKTANVNGQQITYYFSNWEDGNTDNPRIFYASHDVSHTATMKAHLVSMSPTASGPSNQRKLDSFGATEHAVYPSAGSIYYTKNDGSGWSKETRLCYSTTAKNPSIATTYNAPYTVVHVVWEDTEMWNGNEYHNVYYRKSTNSGTTWQSPMQVSEPTGSLPPSALNVDATPVAAGDPLVIVWKAGDIYSGSLKIQVEPMFGSDTYFTVDGSDGTSCSPSLRPMTQGPYRLAYRHGTGKIYYREFNLTGGYPYYSVAFDHSKSADLTAGYGWMSDAANPSIVYDGTRTFVTWDASCAVYEEEEARILGLGIDGIGGNQRHVLVREHTTSWQPVVEFSHYNYPLEKPSVGVNTNSNKVIVMWELNGNTVDKVSRNVTGGTWTGITILDGGRLPSLNHYVYGGNPTYAMYTSGSAPPYTVVMNPNVASKLIDALANKVAEGLEDEEKGRTNPFGTFAENRRGAINLGKLRFGRLPEGTVKGNLWIEKSTPEITRGGVRERWPFLADTSNLSNWLGTETRIMPSDADSIKGTIHLVVRDFEILNPRVQLNTVMFSTDLIQSNSTQNSKRFTLGQLADLEVRDTILSFMLDVPVQTLRGKQLRLRTRLIGQEESQEPAWSVLLTVDSIETGSSAWRRALVTDREDGQAGIPMEFKLHANYPNPFNPSTQINFDLPEAGNVSLVVYDVLGRQVATLATGYHEASYHTVTWNAGSMSSGVYFARFTASDIAGNVRYTKINKLVLMK